MSTELMIAEQPGSGIPAALPDLTDEAKASIREAARTLDGSSLIGRLSGLAGKPLELIGRNLPGPAQDAVARATDLAMKAALRAALTTIKPGEGPRAPRFTRAAAVASGALGGALGLVTLPVELPVSTVLMLRVIGDIARENGEDLSDPETRLACLEVFALGSQSERTELATSGYFAVRTALARSIAQATKVAAARGLADKSAPALVRFTAQIAARFGLVVSQKVAATALPIIGALGGAAVNAAFLEHFRALAQAHFTVRRLERLHGKGAVRAEYEKARADLAAA